MTTFTVPSLDRYLRLEEEARIRESGNHPRGAAAVLDVLRARLGTWVALDTIMAVTGQRAVHSRVSELKRDGWVIEHNGHGGKESAYRLVRR